jgi:predicted dehydrogenase
MIKVGSIGFGRHFRRSLLPNLMAIEDVALTAVAERDPVLRQSASDRFPGVATYETDTQLLSESGVDAVIISTDPLSHVHLANAAIRAGKHVFVEKPLGISSAPVAELAQLAEESGRVVMTGTMWRFAPAHTLVASWMAERGTRPSILNVNATFPEVITRDGWEMNELELAFYDMFIHALDWSTVHIGSPESVTAHILPSRRPHHVEVSVQLRSADGRLGILNLSTASSAYQISTWIHADDGSVIEIDTKERVRITSLPTWSGTPGWIRDRPTLNWEPGQVYRGWSRKGYFEELTEFTERISTGRDVALGAQEAAHTLSVIERCLKAAD